MLDIGDAFEFQVREAGRSQKGERRGQAADRNGDSQIEDGNRPGGEEPVPEGEPVEPPALQPVGLRLCRVSVVSTKLRRVKA